MKSCSEKCPGFLMMIEVFIILERKGALIFFFLVLFDYGGYYLHASALSRTVFTLKKLWILYSFSSGFVA